MTDLPKKCCGRCDHWTRKQPDDLTAPEGKCDRASDAGHWPTGYWPHTLQRDSCPAFQSFHRMP